VFNALKPGGVYIVLDHQSAKGSDFNAQLHRIDEAKVKAEVIAAGFEFVGASTVLRNAADDGTKTVFDPSVRGKTDQFILKFKKPS
jgi:predicted methyltransferase